MEEMGMTNEQYRGMLLDELEVWYRLKKISTEESVLEIVETQIQKINEKLRF